MPEATALEKYQTMIKIIDGKKVVDAKDILSLDWREYRELVTMPNLPTVDHVHVDEPSMLSPLYWMKKDLSMGLTIAFWLTCSAILIGSSLDKPDKMSSAAIGFMSWILIEYGYHRFVGHMPVINDLTKHANFHLHGKHHFAPNDLDHVLLPPFVVFVAAAAVYQFVFANMTKNPEISIAFSILHYLIYDTMHYAIHKYPINDVSRIPVVGNILKYPWRNHIGHHLKPETNFAVTTGGLLRPMCEFFYSLINVGSPSDKTKNSAAQPGVAQCSVSG